jgi:hypothetical protein
MSEFWLSIGHKFLIKRVYSRSRKRIGDYVYKIVSDENRVGRIKDLMAAYSRKVRYVETNTYFIEEFNIDLNRSSGFCRIKPKKFEFDCQYSVNGWIYFETVRLKA